MSSTSTSTSTKACYTVDDKAGLDALPLHTVVSDRDGDLYVKTGPDMFQSIEADAWQRSGLVILTDDEIEEPWLPEELLIYGPIVVENAGILDPDSFVTPEAKPPLEVGDIAVIGDKHPKWEGLRVKILEDTLSGLRWVEPQSSRPDGHGTANFYWETNDLHIEDEPEGVAGFTVGDRVRIIRDGEGDGVLSRRDERLNPDISMALFGGLGATGTIVDLTAERTLFAWDGPLFRLLLDDDQGEKYVRPCQVEPFGDPTPTFHVGDEVAIVDNEYPGGTFHWHEVGAIGTVVDYCGYDSRTDTHSYRVQTMLEEGPLTQYVLEHHIDALPESSPGEPPLADWERELLAETEEEEEGGEDPRLEEFDNLPNGTIIVTRRGGPAPRQKRNGEWGSVQNDSTYHLTRSMVAKGDYDILFDPREHGLGY